MNFLKKSASPAEGASAGKAQRFASLQYCFGALWLALSYFGIEYYASRYLAPTYDSGLTFGFLWALLLTAIALALPRLLGRIFYGVTYLFFAGWSIGQCGYYSIFGRMMWVGDIRYAGEGGAYLSDIAELFAPSWWVATILLLLLGVVGVFLVQWGRRPDRMRSVCFLTGLSAAIGLVAYPTAVFKQDGAVWGAQDEYRRALSREAAYTTMYDARRLYCVAGIYQSAAKDVWQHMIYPLTPMYQSQINRQAAELNRFFESRPAPAPNDMTGIFEGKNVILVLMETMDDWLITEEDTPTLHRLMQEGINFTNFYTPDFGSVRTFNTEFCINTGLFAPTNGQYAFDYITNDFSQSLPNLLREQGYSAEAFHYNSPLFYNRGVVEPAIGYESYNCYTDFGITPEEALSDTCLFENEALMEKFFHGEAGGDYDRFFNFIISRNAHMTYTYDEELSVFALGQYPEYRGKFGNEEVDCIRAKAHCCDDLFTELLRKLEETGHLEDTVIVGLGDHFAYGMQDQGLLMELSGVETYLLVEKTPFFIWSADGPQMEVDKVRNTSDVLPTLLNLFGLENNGCYLGRDAFDESYEGSAVFQDQSWVNNEGAFRNGGVVWRFTEDGPSPEEVADMNRFAEAFVHINNLLMESDYYGRLKAE